MDTIRNEFCPVCSGRECKENIVCLDYLVTHQPFSIYRCPDCGFGFTQDFPSEKEIGKYYDAPEYISHSDTRKGIINSLYHTARNIALRSKTKLVLKYSSPKTGKLLDIGSGTGYFLNAMRKKKWVVTGIEKSDDTRKYAHDKFGLDIQDSEYLFDMPSVTKDVITMWHVLEHVEKLNTVMQNLHRILKEDGTLIIALPNKNSCDAQYYGQWWAAYDVPRHLWHFSPDDFSWFADKHNFKVIKMKRMNFDPFYISMLSEKNKKSKLASIVGFTKGLYFFTKSLSNTKKCSSIVYVLKKK